MSLLRSAAVRTPALRSANALRALPRSAVVPSAAVQVLQSRGYAEKTSPEKQASILLDLLPGNSAATKAGYVTFGTSAMALAISQEWYVANEETVIAAAFLIFLTGIARAMSGPYTEWANGQINKIKRILNGAREQHTAAVQSRIDSVNEQRDVVNTTKQLYAVAKETAQLEKEAFELAQRTAIAAEVKTVLDSWVRFEAQEREDEQKLLAKTVIEKVTSSLRDEKTQKEILENAVAELESLVKNKHV